MSSRGRATTLVATLLLIAATVACSAQRPKQRFVPGEVLVGLKGQPTSSRAITQMSKSLSRVLQVAAGEKTARVSVSAGAKVEDVVRELRKDPNVRYAEPNWIYKMAATPDDPFYGLQYGLQRTCVDAAWDIWIADASTATTPIVIGMLDTGIAMGHEDLFSKVYTDSSGRLVGKNYVNKSNNPWDDNGHGTMTAGIAAARTNNGKGGGTAEIGIAGVAGWDGVAADSDKDSVKILPIKVIDKDGYATAQNVADGIAYAVAQGAKIIYLPLGGFSDSTAIKDEVAAAIAAGVVVVAAAGNDGLDIENYPAAHPSVISVAATDLDGSNTLAPWSNYGSWVTVAAPGVNIFSTTYDGFYGYASGTSMAGALVTGEVALLLAQQPTLTPAQIANLISNYTSSYGSYLGRTIANGLVNVDDAVRAAKVHQGAGLISVSLDGSPTRLYAGATYTGKVKLANAVKAGETVTVALASDNTDVEISVDGGSTWAATGDCVVAAAATEQAFSIKVADNASHGVLRIEGTHETQAADTGPPVLPQVTIVRYATQVPVNPLIATVTIDAGSIAGGNVANVGTVHLWSPAASTETINLTSSDASAVVPASVTVHQGDSDATFSITTTAVASDVTGVKISAQHGTATAVESNAFDVTAAVLSKIELSKTYVYGGATCVATVYYDGKPSADATATVASADTDIATVAGGGTVTVSAATGTGTIVVTSLPTAVEKNVAISVGAGTGDLVKTLYIRPVSTHLSVSPDTVKGGVGMSIGTITLPEPAPVGGLTFALATSPANAFDSFPTDVTIPEGKTSVAFSIDPIPVSSDTVVTITATNSSMPDSVARVTILRPVVTGVQVDPGSALAGASVALSTQIDGPAPTGGIDVALTSTDAVAFPLPAGNKIAIAAGLTSGSSTVTLGAVSSTTSVTIGAKIGSDTAKTGTMNVLAPIGDFTITPASVAAGTSVTGTISTNGVLSTTADTTITLTATAGGAALGTLPTVKILKNAVSTTFTIPTVAVASDTSVTIQAAVSGTTKAASFTVLAPQMTGISLSPTTIVHNSKTNTSTGTVSLDAATPVAGLSVSLRSSNTAVATVSSPATYNATTKTWQFTVTSAPVTGDSTATIYATMGSVTKSTSVTVKPLLASVAVTPSTITGGSTGAGIITLNAEADAGAPAITVASQRTTVATVSAVTTVTGKVLQRAFTVTGLPLSGTKSTTITASCGISSKTTAVTVTRTAVASLAISPASITYGASTGTTATGTVTLSGNAPVGGLAVALSIQNSLVATIPASVTVAAGQKTGTFTITSKAVAAATTTVVKATVGTSSATANVTVSPLISSLTVPALTGGKSFTGSVTLSGTPANPTVVYLTSDKPDLVYVPASITITNGSKTPTFTVRVNGVGSATTVNIRATCNNVTVKKNASVAAGPNMTIRLSPTSVMGGRNVTGVIQVNSAVTGAAFVVTLAATGDDAALVTGLPASVTIPVGKKSITFAFSTTTADLPTQVTITGTNGTLSKSTVLTITP